MKRFVSRLLAIGVVLAIVSPSLGQDQGKCDNNNHRNPEQGMTSEQNAKILLEIFHAIEQRDERRVAELFDADFEIHWPASLPYGGSWRGRPTKEVPTWGSTWGPLQPTQDERQMDPRVVAAGGDEVVVLWRQRGLSPAGERFDGEVVGLYRLRNGKLIRAQMFYFDTAAVARFLSSARGQASSAKR